MLNSSNSSSILQVLATKTTLKRQRFQHKGTTVRVKCALGIASQSPSISWILTTPGIFKNQATKLTKTSKPCKFSMLFWLLKRQNLLQVKQAMLFLQKNPYLEKKKYSKGMQTKTYLGYFHNSNAVGIKYNELQGKHILDAIVCPIKSHINNKKNRLGHEELEKNVRIFVSQN